MKSKLLTLLLGLSISVFLVDSSYSQPSLVNSILLNQAVVSSQETAARSMFPVVPQQTDTMYLRNAWGIDVLLSTGGFGLGGFYRRQYTETVSGFVSFSISEAKHEREREVIDPFTFPPQTVTPGKINRFLVIPLLFGVQYRVFKDAIMENFRPYITAAAGPSMVYSSPYSEEEIDGNVVFTRKVDFFKAIGKGQAHYTLGGYVGIGTFFGFDRKNLFGINIRYYLVPLRNGIESLKVGSGNNAEILKKSGFGGFFITLSFGSRY